MNAIVTATKQGCCTNCRRKPGKGQHLPYRYEARWFCCLDCLYGLHPELMGEQ